MKIKLLSVLVAGVVLAGCSKMSSYQDKAMEFRQQCFGDHTIKCRAMMVDVGIAQLEAGVELVGKSEEQFVACRGRAAYDEGISLFHEKIDYYKSLKPNIFMRTVLSDMQTEFMPKPFKHEREFEEFVRNLDQCRKGGGSPTATAGAVAIQGKIDSNAPEVKGAIDTVAGQLTRIESTTGNAAVALNGRPLFTGDDANWQYPVRVFKLSQNREAILFTSTGGRGNSCESLFFFLVPGAQGVKPTPEFGTCAPTGSYAQQGDRITITLPRMGGNSVFVFDGTTLTEDGNPVQLSDSNDPSK